MDSPDYDYESLSGPRDIRILKLMPGEENEDIYCELDCVSLDDKPEYEAISYVWGDPKMTRKIRCGRGVLDVTVNLYSVLHQIRSPTALRKLWADAVCEYFILF